MSQPALQICRDCMRPTDCSQLGRCMQNDCPACNGEGKTDEVDPCPDCEGDGLICYPPDHPLRNSQRSHHH